MAEGQLVIGVDGGATKTLAVALLLTEGGTRRDMVGQGAAGSSNRNSAGEAAAEGALADAVGKALAQCGRALCDVQCIVLGMSGCDREEDVQYWRQACSRLVPTAVCVVENDAVIALCSGTDGVLHGIVVISGTGSIGMAVHGEQRVRAGGWGPLLGDAGNGYAIGLAALAAVTRAEDGRAATRCPLLKSLVLKHLGRTSVEDILGWAYGEGSKGAGDWDRIAALAPCVFQAAKNGCATSEAVLVRTGEDIAELAETVAKRSGLAGGENFQVVLAGGVNADGDSVVARTVRERLQKELPSAQLVRPDAGVSPAVAAANLAARIVCTKSGQ